MRGAIAVKTQYGFEWPTMVLLGLCYFGWTMGIRHAETIGPFATIALLGLCLAMYSSLQHEALHGHPTNWSWLNTLLVLAPVGIVIPYQRFRDLHLAHHRDTILTDPFDDPESYYVHADHWGKYPGWLKQMLTWNNTLAGRMAIGPALGICGFWASEAKRIAGGDSAVLLAWIAHALLLVPVCLLLAGALKTMWWAYPIAVYIGMSLIYVRTFLEHRAHENPHSRTVIIEDRGLFSLLFLNNNLHAVHHARPALPWYALPDCYRRNRDRFLTCNRHYRFQSYGEIFRRYAFRRKEPVVHPFAASRGQGKGGTL